MTTKPVWCSSARVQRASTDAGSRRLTVVVRNQASGIGPSVVVFTPRFDSMADTSDAFSDDVDDGGLFDCPACESGAGRYREGEVDRPECLSDFGWAVDDAFAGGEEQVARPHWVRVA